MSEVKIHNLAIIGVGLIGGSLAIALRNAGVTSNIIGCGRSEANLQKAVTGLNRFNQQIQETLTRLQTEPQNIAYLSRLGRLFFLKGSFSQAFFSG